MRVCYAYPPFFQLAQVLTNFAFERGRVVLRIPNWYTTGEHSYCRRLLDHMPVARTEPPNGAIYFSKDS